MTDIGRVTDDGENDVGLGSDGFGGIGPVSTEREERLGLGLGAGEDGEGVAGVEEVGAHGAAHYASADPA